MSEGLTRGETVCQFIEAHCRVPEGALVGEKIKLAPFQRRFILETYDGDARRAYLSIARKNGKTALIAGIVLAHLVSSVAEPNSQIVSGALSRDQAALVFSLAAKMVQLDPVLAGVVRIVPSGKRLYGLNQNTEYRALAADGSTAHGLSPIVAILDEIGQIRGPQSDFVDAITTSQGAHARPLLIAISTQAANDSDLFSLWLDDAEKSGDPRVVSHVYAADPDADLMDEAAWRAANPALDVFRSREDLSEQAERASRMPTAENTFRNLCLNQRVSVHSPFVSRSVWEACSGESSIDPDYPVWAGLDLSARADLTAFVVIQKRKGEWHVAPYFWTPEKGLMDRVKRDRAPYDVWVREGFLRTTPGATVDYRRVCEDIAEILDGLTVEGISYDRWRIDQLRHEMNAIGADFPLVEHGQGYKDMSPAIDEIEADLLNARLRHGGHPVLTMCAFNSVVVKDPAGGRKLDKAKSTGRIDGMVALVMARGKTNRVDEAEPEYKMFFI